MGNSAGRLTTVSPIHSVSFESFIHTLCILCVYYTISKLRGTMHFRDMLKVSLSPTMPYAGFNNKIIKKLCLLTF